MLIKRIWGYFFGSKRSRFWPYTAEELIEGTRGLRALKFIIASGGISNDWDQFLVALEPRSMSLDEIKENIGAFFNRLPAEHARALSLAFGTGPAPEFYPELMLYFLGHFGPSQFAAARVWDLYLIQLEISGALKILQPRDFKVRGFDESSIY